MSDFLVNLSENRAARAIVKSTGLPLPMPERLRRPEGPYVERLLEGRRALLVGNGDLTRMASRTLARAGADTHVPDEAMAAAFDEMGEAYGRRAHRGEREPGEGEEIPAFDGIVLDATGVRDAAGLRTLYELLHPAVGRIARCGRIVVLGRPADEAATPAASAARAALDGFTRSVAKEIGKRGATANLIVVDGGADERLEPVLRFLLSDASAFVSAQPLRVSSHCAIDADVPYVRPLDGKIALVTGAARGIGAATARRLAAEGAHVVCLDRPADEELASEVAREIDGSVLLADVSDAEAPKHIAADLKKRRGGVDIVVHNAGITRDKTLARMSPEAWDAVLGINLDAVERITAALRKSTLRDGGRIICLSSVAGIAGNVGQTNYAASKAGVIGLVRHLSADLSERGITVNAVAPGFIETRLTDAIPFMVREFARRLSALGQGGLPEDVAETVTFLATPGAAGITGNVLRICGGALIGA